MTKHSVFLSPTTLDIALSLGLLAATACGSSDTGAGSAAESAAGTMNASGGSGTVGPGIAGAMSPAGVGGAGAGGPTTGGAAAACEAGSSVQGGGADTCPDLPWRCVDSMVSNPPFHLAGAECSAGHTGACCNYTDKCLTNTNGSPGAQSAVEVATGPCQAGCVANPSAQACLDCINASLQSTGSPALSNGCGTCFTNLISCSFTNCLGQCIGGSSAPGCRECVFNSCTIGAGKFNECSGTLGNAPSKS